MKMVKPFDIAKSSLRECYAENGILAGKTHYSTYWSRDSFYASWGALELGDLEIVKKNLENFLNYTKKGQVPLRIGASLFGQIISLIGIKPGFGVRYKEDKGFNESMDPNLLFLITFHRYVTKANDLDFAKKNLEKIKEIVSWLEKREKKNLIYSGNYSTWQDSLKKKGFVLYTNTLYYDSLKRTGELFDELKIKNELGKKAVELKKEINEKFWNEKLGHYVDYFKNDKFDQNKNSKIFASGGNLFSIVLGIADEKRSKSILKKADELGISKGVPSKPNVPQYKGFREVSTLLWITGLKDYNNGKTCWPWIGSLHAIALKKVGENKKSKEIIKKLSKYVSRDKDFYEIYENTGNPMSRFFYKSEHPFSWSAGFFILADRTLEKNKK